MSDDNVTPIRQPTKSYSGPSPGDVMTTVARAAQIVRAVNVAQEQGDDDADAFGYALDQAVDMLEQAASDLANLNDVWQRIKRQPDSRARLEEG